MEFEKLILLEDEHLDLKGACEQLVGHSYEQKKH